MAQEKSEGIEGRASERGRYHAVEAGGHILTFEQKDGEIRLMEITPIPTYSHKVGISRRAFIVGAPSLAGLLYSFGGGWDFMGGLGKILNAGINPIMEIGKTARDAFKAVTGQLELEELVRSLESQDKQTDALYKTFIDAYKTQHELAQSARKVDEQYAAFSKAWNGILEKTPLNEFKKTPVYGVREKIQEGLQKLLGRDIANPDYIKRFGTARDTNIKLQEAMEAMEDSLKTALSEGNKEKVEEIMRDYVYVTNARNEYLKRIKPENLTALADGYFNKFESQLQSGTAGRFIDYAAKGREMGLNLEKWVPWVGLGATVGAALAVANVLNNTVGSAVAYAAGVADKYNAQRLVSRGELTGIDTLRKYITQLSNKDGGNQK